jgi:RsiW-degrading membrane proteinase PrsW (M82 family)
MNTAAKLNTPLKRALYNSPLNNTLLQLVAALAVTLLFIWAFPTLQKYYTQAPLPMLAGMALAALVYLPTLFVLAFMMRRKRVPRLFFWAAPLSIILFFGPLTSATNNWFIGLDVPNYLFVGFSEETWKIMPLLLILVFARPAITSVRDGVFYGALGGFGFACLEMAAYFALDDYPVSGWSGFALNSLSRATLLGADLHIIWSAFLGGAIVYGLSSVRLWTRITVPLFGYILVLVTHGLQDSVYGKILAVAPLILLEPIFVNAGVTEESLSAFAVPMTMATATINLFLVNLLVLPLLIWLVLRGGSSDRTVIAEYLRGENDPLILTGEKPGLEEQKRFHRRWIGADNSIDKTIVRAQNEFAFRKNQLQQADSSDMEDLIAESLREEVSQLRSADSS